MAEVIMPRLSDTMEEGSVQRWLKQPGDAVAVGDLIAEIETDKAVMELEAYESGVLQQILVPEGEVVPIGQPIAIIGEGAVAAGAPAPAAPSAAAGSGNGAAAAPGATAGAPGAAAAPPQAAATAPEAGAAPSQPASSPSSPSQPSPAEAAGGEADGRRILATPVARRIAEEHGIDLRRVQGTGPDGRILRENVEEFVRQAGAGGQEAAAAAGASTAPAAPAQAAASATPAAPAPAPPAQAPGRPAPAPTPGAATAAPLSRMRRAIARSMTESKPGIPHIYVASEIDMGAAMELRRQINAEAGDGVRVSVNDLIVKAAAKALRAVPAINSSYALTEDGHPGVIQHEQVNISIATALDDGLVAPVVRDTDKKSLSTIAAEIKDMAGRAREGKLRQNELDGATFQVSNLGMFDVLAFVSVITPPQAGSLAVGSVRRVPVVREDGRIEPAEMMQVILSTDHRVTDGATSARWLQELKRLLESPLRLLV
jgi:pyruvate dehydrogenase E2 component (dihydrolipoamide acetyltransferase)